MAGQVVVQLVEGLIFRPQHDRLLGAQAVLVRVFPGYNFAAGSFSKGDPVAGLHRLPRLQIKV